MADLYTKTKIVATVGPASSSREMLGALIEAGVDIFRLNMGHTNHKDADEVIARIRKASPRCAILVDLQGPKIRLTEFEGTFELTTGQSIRVRSGNDACTSDVLTVHFEELLEAVEVGHHFLIDDGLIRLKITERIGRHEVLTEVVAGGTIKPRKGVSAPDTRLTPENYLDDQDRADLSFAARQKVDFIAASFVSRAADIEAVRAGLGDARADTQIIAKIESRVGVENFAEILAATDGVMIARGDLGVELPPEQVPLIQKKLIKACNASAKPVIVATQMLESMVVHRVASRAETSDVANAILDGTDAVMLSAETSVGRHPVEAVRTLVRISNYVEREATLFREELYQRPSTKRADFVCKSAARASEELELDAIVCVTSSGFTARNMAAFRPSVRILATTPSDRVIRHLATTYAVHCIQAEHIGRYDVMLHHSLSALMDKGLLALSDQIAVIGGIPVGKPGSTNMLQIGTVAELMELD